MSTCPSPLANDTTAAVLRQFLPAAGATADDYGTLLQALTCSGLLADACPAICPNQDLAGIGVRVALRMRGTNHLSLELYHRRERSAGIAPLQSSP